MQALELIKMVGAPVTAGLIVFAANKFYEGAKLLINHDHQIKDLVKASTIDIPKKIDNLNDQITKTHTMAIELFAAEIHPIKEDMKLMQTDIGKIKAHTRFNKS